MFLCLYIYFSIFSWVCDDEQDCGSSPQGTLDVSDEDPVRCRGNVSCSGNQFLCKVSTIPRIESEWGEKLDSVFWFHEKFREIDFTKKHAYEIKTNFSILWISNKCVRGWSLLGKKTSPNFFFTYTTSLFRETIYFFFFLGKEYIKEHKNKSTTTISIS